MAAGTSADARPPLDAPAPIRPGGGDRGSPGQPRADAARPCPLAAVNGEDGEALPSPAAGTMSGNGLKTYEVGCMRRLRLYPDRHGRDAAPRSAIEALTYAIAADGS
ncbi:hypothetical protein BOBR111200_10570 [Bordetella bronchialis]|uniref:Uncharacterized protein n=1 Tax=Bordetella bronchialis TaxID=463025 RepID=A0ABN4R0D3_9BORD|nr:hypothetical protein BAU06_04580 [Bordetella bronchialis]